MYLQFSCAFNFRRNCSILTVVLRRFTQRILENTNMQQALRLIMNTAQRCRDLGPFVVYRRKVVPDPNTKETNFMLSSDSINNYIESDCHARQVGAEDSVLHRRYGDKTTAPAGHARRRSKQSTDSTAQIMVIMKQTMRFYRKRRSYLHQNRSA